MNYDSLKVDIQGHIAHVQLSRPDTLNIMDQVFWSEFPAAIMELDRQERVRVIILSSTGKHFSAGIDLSLFAPGGEAADMDLGRKAEKTRRLIKEFQSAFSLLEQIRVPIFSAIQGGCIGAGFDLICASDSRYCSEDAFFTIKETDVGMVADLGTLQRLPGLIPEGLVRELAYTGRKMKADEALHCGLVNRVFTNYETMLNEVMNIAEVVASKSPLVVSGCKEMISHARDHTVEEGLNYVATWQSSMFDSEDVTRSISAGKSKSNPEYENLLPRKSFFKK